jgi:FkbM family methyltransferase
MVDWFKRKTKTSAIPSIYEVLTSLNGSQANILFDIGAHHGRYAALMNSKIGIQTTFCFEPTPESFAILNRNLVGLNYKHFSIAFSDFDGKAFFNINSFEETNSLLNSAPTGTSIDTLTKQKSQITVNVLTLDHFCDENRVDIIDILKIDAQGNTLPILNGAKKILEHSRVKLIQCEVEFIRIYESQYLYHDVAKYLDHFGYCLYSLYNIHHDINGRISWADAIFLKQ